MWKSNNSIFSVVLVFSFIGLTSAVSRNGSAALSISGAIPPVFTPFYANYTVNYDLIPKYAKYFAQIGFKAVLVGGTTGEHMVQTMEERLNVIDTWVKAGKELGLKVIAQVGGGPLKDVIAMAKHVEKIGAAAILTLPELYYRPTTVEALVDYVELIANEVPHSPVLYYHHPKKSFVTLPMPQFVQEATRRIPNFKGLKFTSPDLNEAYTTLRHLKNDQALFLANDGVLAGAALLGFTSATGGSFNLFPKQYMEIMSAVERGDLATAQKIQDHISKALEAIGVEGRLPAMKASMKLLSGLDMGPPRLPLKPLSKEALEKLKSRYLELGLFHTQCSK